MNRPLRPHARVIGALLACNCTPPPLQSHMGNLVNTRQSERSAALLLIGAIALNIALIIW